MARRDPEAWKRRIKRRSFIVIAGAAILTTIDVLSKVNGARSLLEWLSSRRSAPDPGATTGTIVASSTVTGVGEAVFTPKAGELGLTGYPPTLKIGRA